MCVLRIVVAVTCMAMFSGCFSARISDDPIAVLDAPVQSVKGPKRTIAVGKFDSIGALTAKYGDWDVGGGMAAMLTTALVESGEFIVLERAHLDKILTEQQMSGSKVSAKGTGPAVGQLYGAQLLIFGAVTKFGDDFSGGGASAGSSGVGLGKLGGAGGSVAVEKSRGQIGLDIRIVDTTTGAIISTFKVDEDIKKKGKDLSGTYASFSIGGNRFMRTPVGQAARSAITKVVQHVAGAAGRLSWKGRVVDVENMDVHVNAGSKSDVRPGDRFIIERVTKRFTDPDTGKLLSERKKTLGTLEVNVALPEMASGIFQPQSDLKPQRGDLVIFEERIGGLQ